MSKRIYLERVKKYGIGIGATGIPLAVLLIWYLASLGSITITSFSGDTICAGTELDPCYAYINFTVNEDIFIYPNESWSMNLFTEPKAKSIQMYRSWGSSWREIKLNQSCTGTWCGLSNSKDKRVFSFAFREGRDYQIRFKVLKENSNETIKWGFGEIDPKFYGNEKIKEYSKEERKVTLLDKSSKDILIEQKLITPLEYKVHRGYNQIAQIERSVLGENKTIGLFTEVKKGDNIEWIPTFSYDKDFNFGISKIKLINVSSGEEINRQIDIKYLDYENKIVNDYEISCMEIEVKNGTIQNCSKILVGNHIEKQEVWKDINFTKKLDFYYEVNEWASWTEDLNVDIVAYWNFDDIGEATDSLGIENGTVNGVVFNESGIIGGAYNVSGALNVVNVSFVNQKINMSDAPMSLSVWVWMPSTAGTFCMISSSEGQGYQFCINGDTFGLGKASVDLLESTDNVGEDAWVHLVAVYNDSNEQYLYINGVADSGNPHAYTSTFDVSKVYGVAFRTIFTGLIDEFGIWERCLIPSEVTDLYNGGDGITYGSDEVPPDVDIESPTNSSYNTEIIDFNVTITDTSGGDSCWYSINSNDNVTMNNDYGDHYEDRNDSVGVGEFSVRFYCNDTFGNLNDTEEVSFLIDLINPEMEITYPQNTSYGGNITCLNYTYTEINKGYCWWSLNDGNINSSIVSMGTNFTDITSSEGSNNLTLYCNDTANNINLTSVVYFQDALLPEISITSPSNNTNTTDYYTEINYTRSDTYLDSCWYSNDTYDVNKTLVDCVNITGVFWAPGNHNVTIWANDSYGNENNASISFNILVMNLTVTSQKVEFGSEINITANISSNTNICVDILNFTNGINYTCGINNFTLEFDIDSFVKNLFGNGSANFTIDYGIPSYILDVHQYDEMDNLSFNISGINSPRNISFYESNSTRIDRILKGTLIGNTLQLSNFTNSTSYTLKESFENISIYNPNVGYTTYFLIDDSAKRNGFLNISFNVSGESTTFENLDSFHNWSNIDETLTTCQLNPAGGIMLANSSKSSFIYDSYDSDVDTDRFLNYSSNIDYAYVTEINDYLKLHSEFPESLVGGGYYGETNVTLIPNYTYNGIHLREVDELEFNLSTDYEAYQDYRDPVDYSASTTHPHGRIWLYFNGEGDDSNVIWKNTYLNRSLTPAYGAGYTYASSDMTFKLKKINKTTWSVNISGWETSEVNRNYDACEKNTEMIYNWTTGSYYIDSADNNCDVSGTLNNSFYWSVNSSYHIALRIKSYSLVPSGTQYSFVDKSDAYLYPINYSLWYRDNCSVFSKSMYDSPVDILEATFNFGGNAYNLFETYEGFLSADGGDNWENISNGVEHTFSNTGKSLKWRIDLNTTTPSYNNVSIFINQVNLTLLGGTPTNLTFDLGDDGIIDYTLYGNISEVNGSIPIDLTNADISSIFQNKITNTNHLYYIPLTITSARRGLVNLDALNLSYNPNPIYLNVSKFQDYVSNLSGKANASLNISFQESGSSINLENLSQKYAGGNKTYKLIAHTEDYLVNKTTSIDYFYSKWDYSMPVDYLEFIPATYDSKNVTPFGQSNAIPILNITNYGYGGLDVNLSALVNNTLNCVNLTISTNNSKMDGHRLNYSWVNLTTLSYGETVTLWLWSDYECDYSNWYLFNPYLYFKQCCAGCYCTNSTE